jgi:hypothetical protein
MPCLMAWVLARRASIAAISLSMSERTVAIARCSSLSGTPHLTCTSLVYKSLQHLLFQLQILSTAESIAWY